MKKVLMIVTAFSPENAIGSVRTTKIVKYLVRSGFEVTVVKPQKQNMIIDRTLIMDELNSVRVIEISHSKLFNKILMRQRNKVLSKSSASQLIIGESANNNLKSILMKYIYTVYTFIKAYDWMNEVKRKFVCNHSLNAFDYVISSYPSLESHLSANYVKKKKIAKFWIADFRDTLVYSKIDNSLSKFLKNLIEIKFRKNMDLLTTISKGLVTNLKQKHGDKVVLLNNGFDLDDIELLSVNSKNIYYEFSKKKKITMSYVGSFYGGIRDISIIFEVIKELIDDNLIEQNEVAINYAGKEFNVLKSQAEKYGLVNICRDWGMVTREDSINIQRSSKASIVCTWNEKNNTGIVTGKIYESLLLRKPIVSIINGYRSNCDIVNIVEETNLGISLFSEETSLNEKKSLKDFLMKISENKSMQVNEEALGKYEYQNILNDFISNLIEKET